MALQSEVKAGCCWCSVIASSLYPHRSFECDNAFITLSEADRQRLNVLVADRNTAQKHVWRARIVLMSVDGLLRDKPRPPGKPPVTHDRTSMIVAMTLKPALFDATHWTARAMARVAGLAASAVQKIWKAHALVLSIDEKFQIQALDRTQPGLPLKKGRGPTMTHEFKRNGTTTLFAALNVLTGEVFGRNMQCNRHQEFLRFLNAPERDIPASKVIHGILDNFAAHKHEKVRAWLKRHPRWTFHFIPTSSSWLNAVEGFFAILTRRRLQNGIFHSVVDLQAAINRFIAEHNKTPKRFVWRADPDAIIAARNRGFQALESIH